MDEFRILTCGLALLRIIMDKGNICRSRWPFRPILEKPEDGLLGE